MIYSDGDDALFVFWKFVELCMVGSKRCINNSLAMYIMISLRP